MIFHNMKPVRIFLAGDSTMGNYGWEQAPRAGWGQFLSCYLPSPIQICNHAASGRSSKSFIAEGRLAAIEAEINKGDFLFIQFGHNDQKLDEERHTEPFDSFKYCLNEYIEVARRHGATPLLITAVQRRCMNECGILKDTHGDYNLAMIELAEAKNVVLIDLGEWSRKLIEGMGIESSKSMFLWLTPGEHPNYPDGIEDNTHFSEFGARTIASWVAQQVQEKLRL